MFYKQKTRGANQMNKKNVVTILRMGFWIVTECIKKSGYLLFLTINESIVFSWNGR